jgi:hypothetical protein
LANGVVLQWICHGRNQPGGRLSEATDP